MADRHQSLLQEIEREAVGSKGDIAVALRKCLLLGSMASSAELRDWASRELKGYEIEDELPAYRKLNSNLFVDGANIRFQITKQAIPVSAIPDFAQEVINENVELRMPISEIAKLAADTGDGSFVRLGPPSWAEVVRYMNGTGAFSHGFKATDLYWEVSRNSIAAIEDNVRTTLTELVAELRAGHWDETAPDPELAAEAVSIAIYGKRNRVSVANTKTTASEEATVSYETVEADRSFWTTTVGLFTILGAVGTIIAAIVGWLVFIR